jgi:acetolactate synthase-1/2/3 large subunit
MECLVREGVEYVFGYSGGANLPLYDQFKNYPVQHILVRHEQAATHAADAYARITGKAGVAFGTSGPGATNLITGITNAWMDSIPLVCITGEVVTSLIGRDGFQEADITGMTIPCTKHNALVLRVEDIAPTLREMFYVAQTGRPGPVLIDIPRDVLQQTTEFHWPEKVSLRGYKPTYFGHPAQVKKAAQLINESQRPLILAGHGIILSQAYDELRTLAETADIPVITTLLGISSFPGSHPLYLGMPGMHGLYWNNMAIQEADLVIGIGMRFDDRVTGSLKDFAPHARIIHIEIDPAEIGKNVRTTVPIVGDAKHVLGQLMKYVEPGDHTPWKNWIADLRRKHPSIAIPKTDKVLPQWVIRNVIESAGQRDGYIVTGVGQHQMWSMQHYWQDKPNSFVTSGGLGTMGFEVPAAVGVQFAAPTSLVWSICGDSGFQMTLQELATVAEYELPIKYAIINNRFQGMVRQWQNLFYNNNISQTRMRNPDFVKLAESYGILGLRATTKEEAIDAIEQANLHPGPVVIDFVVEPEENVYPMMPPGASLSETIDQPPVADPENMEPRVEVIA